MKIDTMFQAKKNTLNYFAPFCLHLQSYVKTVIFLWSDTAAIHFAASSVQLLFEGSSYSTEAFIRRNTICLTFTCLKHASYKMYLCLKKKKFFNRFFLCRRDALYKSPTKARSEAAWGCETEEMAEILSINQRSQGEKECAVWRYQKCTTGFKGLIKQFTVPVPFCLFLAVSIQKIKPRP